MEELYTHQHLVRDLLQLAIDGQWSGQTNLSCHCHPEYAASCPDCEVLARSDKDHESTCKRWAAIKAARAYLQVENDLAEERGEDGSWIP